MEELLHLTSAVADAVNTSDSSDPRILESRQQLRYNVCKILYLSCIPQKRALIN